MKVRVTILDGDYNTQTAAYDFQLPDVDFAQMREPRTVLDPSDLHAAGRARDFRNRWTGNVASSIALAFSKWFIEEASR